jgi:ribosomal protein L22
MSPGLPRRRRTGAQETVKPEEAAAAQEGAAVEEASAAQEASAETQPVAKERGAATKRSARATKQPAAPAEAEPAAEEPAQAAPTPRPRPAARRPGAGATISAKARYVRSSPRKARIVCVHLRGKSVGEARAILAHTPRGVARQWSKLLESAVANAEHNYDPPLQADDLVVRAAYADAGPTIKRYRPRAMGRATPILKRTSHLTITLGSGS